MKKINKLVLTVVTLLALAAPIHGEELMGVEIHGFASQGYLQSTDNNFFAPTSDGTFAFNEFGINFSKEMTNKLRVGVQFFGKDLGPYGNDEIKLDWAFADYRWKDWLGVRAGKIKGAHGLYNETRDVDMLRNSIFLPQSVYSEILRDTTLSLIGGGIYGLIDLKKFGSLSYQAFAGTQDIDANESLSQILQGRTSDSVNVRNTNIDVNKKYVFSLVWDTPLDGLRFGGTWSKADMDLISAFDFTNDPLLAFFGKGNFYFNIVPESMVFSVEYTWNDLLLVAEYITSDRDVVIENFGGELEEFKSDGWYVGTSYRFSEWFELGSYYSVSYSDRNDRNGSNFDPNHRGYLKDASLTARFDISENWTFKLEGHVFDGTTTLIALDNPAPDDGSEQFTKSWQMVAAKVTFSF